MHHVQPHSRTDVVCTCWPTLLDYLVISLLPGQNFSVSRTCHQISQIWWKAPILADFGHFGGKKFGYIRSFNTVLSRRVTAFHSQAKRFELNFFIRETFPWTVKPDGQNHPYGRSICLVLGSQWNHWYMTHFLWLNRWNSTFNNILRTRRFLRKSDVNIFWLASLHCVEKKSINWTMQVFKPPEFDLFKPTFNCLTKY